MATTKLLLSVILLTSSSSVFAVDAVPAVRATVSATEASTAVTKTVRGRVQLQTNRLVTSKSQSATTEKTEAKKQLQRRPIMDFSALDSGTVLR